VQEVVQVRLQRQRLEQELLVVFLAGGVAHQHAAARGRGVGGWVVVVVVVWVGCLEAGSVCAKH
jgi:hypothetical protein